MSTIASIEKINKITPPFCHGGMPVAHILGWQVLLQNNKFKSGDMCIFVRRGTVLPANNQFEFIRPYTIPIPEENGYLITNLQYMGDLSQGLALPLSILSCENTEFLHRKANINKLLGLKSYTSYNPFNNYPVRNINSRNLLHTAKAELQEKPTLYKALQDKSYYIATKPDGIEITFYYIGHNFGICGATGDYVFCSDNPLWQFVQKKKIVQKLAGFRTNIAISGYFCGPDAGTNTMNLRDNNFYISSILETDTMKYYDLVHMLKAALQIKLPPVHIEESGSSFGYTIKEIIKKSQGRYTCGNYKKGIIVSESDAYIHQGTTEPLCFEILNDDYLLEEAHRIRYLYDNMASFRH